MKNANGTGPDNKKTYLTYGALGVGLLVALVLKNIAVGLIIGLIGVSIVEYIYKKKQ